MAGDRGPGRDDSWVSAGALVFSSAALMNLVGRNAHTGNDEIIAAVGFSTALRFFIIRLWSFETHPDKGSALDAGELLTAFGLGCLAFAIGVGAFMWHMTPWATLGMSVGMIIAMFLGTVFNRNSSQLGCATL
jgi:putative flippase GtrA